jgi:AGCS family alanine or glycine:cation symporter
MQKILFALLFILTSQVTFSQEQSFADKIDAGFKPVVDFLDLVIFYKPFESLGFGMPIVVLWLIIGAVFFTFRMGFINIRGFKHAIDLVRGRYDNPDDKGEVSHFQGLVTALSGTVGLGNIGGVAAAISMGGPGATFWMIVAGLIGMSSKFVECTLGLKYRKINEDGVVSGGPMYYLSRGFALRDKVREKMSFNDRMDLSKGEKGLMSYFGIGLAALFAILCVGGSVGGGNMYQANQAFEQLSSTFSGLADYKLLFGVFLAALVGIVIIGGIKSIASVTDKIVPLMVGIYVISALIVIGAHINQIGVAFGAIFNGAFNPEAIGGGIIGVLIVGFQRAAFSNEAGVGSASIAHSAVKTDKPISEGLVALLEPFIDTVVVCTMTALVIIFTGSYETTQGLSGTSLTSSAFESVLGENFRYVMSFAVLLFAFSTMLAWSYYGLKAWTYLFGDSKASDYSYKIMFMAFVIIGTSSNLGSVLAFSDMMILAMAFPNILGLFILSGEVRADLKSYFQKLKSGEIVKYK